MTQVEKEVIRQDLMECVGHYVNDVQLEIHINDWMEEDDFEGYRSTYEDLAFQK
jgi:hypothetical protein